MTADNCFAADFSGARARFLAAAGAAGARIETIRHPLRGPAGEMLACDVARRGPPRAPKALVTISATHGVEGYCGSGAQTASLREGLFADLPPDTCAVAIHAINPHGFAWTRRVTEDNVDLNRNFVDHSAPYPVNAGYEELRTGPRPRAPRRARASTPMPPPMAGWRCSRRCPAASIPIPTGCSSAATRRPGRTGRCGGSSPRSASMRTRSR
jgi:hypothetical protein